MGMTPGSTGMNFLKGGLTGLSQGLANYNNPHPVFDFSGLAQGFRVNRPALGQGITPNAKQPGTSNAADTFDRSKYPGGVFPWDDPTQPQIP